MNTWPVFAEDEIEAVTRVLRSGKVNYWTGDEGRAFEKEFAAATDTTFAVALANGTIALELALAALQLPTGADVIVTPRTFVASVSVVNRAGLTPVCADVDLASGNINAASIRAALTPSTRAILCVHLGGWPCDMPAIMEVARAHDLAVIEDCAQAHGARIDGRSVGSFGSIAAWSFCQDKIITTGGEGGMLTTNDAELYERVWAMKDHGKNRARAEAGGERSSFRWVHDSFGTNGRMTEPQAAIGRRQLAKLPTWTARRDAIARRIMSACRASALFATPLPANRETHAWYRCYARVVPDMLRSGWDRDRLLFALQDAGVPCSGGSCSEVYRELAFAGTSLAEASCPQARLLGEQSIAFLVHPTLSDADLDAICANIARVSAAATR